MGNTYRERRRHHGMLLGTGRHGDRDLVVNGTTRAVAPRGLARSVLMLFRYGGEVGWVGLQAVLRLRAGRGRLRPALVHLAFRQSVRALRRLAARSTTRPVSADAFSPTVPREGWARISTKSLYLKRDGVGRDRRKTGWPHRALFLEARGVRALYLDRQRSTSYACDSRVSG
jgi:hypothetical protein